MIQIRWMRHETSSYFHTLINTGANSVMLNLYKIKIHKFIKKLYT
jgi:hypothetical protein